MTEADSSVEMNSEKPKVKRQPKYRKSQKLTALVRRRKAAKALAGGASVTDALRMAGYSESTAKHSHPAVLNGIRDQLALELDRQLPRDEIVAELIHQARHAAKVERILDPKTGVISTFSDPDPYARLKAIELLAKLTGSLVMRVEGKVEHTDRLAEMIAAGRRRLEELSKEPPITTEIVHALPAQTESSADALPPDIDMSGLKTGAELLGQERNG
jgi:hypothetical protein